MGLGEAARGLANGLILVVNVTVILFVTVLFGTLLVLYSVDFVKDLGVLGFFALGFFLTVASLLIYWGAVAVQVPAAIALSVEARLSARLGATALVIAGAPVAFLLWQAQNWLLYGVLGLEPWLYNKAFGPLGLDV